MFTKIFKIGMVLGILTALWCHTPEAQAQRRGGRDSRPSGVGVYVGPGGVGVEYRPRGYYDGYRSGYYRDNDYRNGYWSGGRWYDGSPRYYQPNYVLPYTESYESYYQDPSPPDKAIVRVRVPDPNADVFFNGSATQQRGAERMFETPSLNNDNTHTYTIKCRWRDSSGEMIERTQSVNVARGRESLVDFTQTRREEQIPVTPNKGDPENPK